MSPGGKRLVVKHEWWVWGPSQVVFPRTIAIGNVPAIARCLHSLCPCIAGMDCWLKATTGQQSPDTPSGRPPPAKCHKGHIAAGSRGLARQAALAPAAGGRGRYKIRAVVLLLSPHGPGPSGSLCEASGRSTDWKRRTPLRAIGVYFLSTGHGFLAIDPAPRVRFAV